MHMWQKKTFWEEGLLCLDDIEALGSEEIEALPPVPARSFGADPHVRLVVERLQKLKKDFDRVVAGGGSSGSGGGGGLCGHDLASFWHRKTGKVVLSVLVVHKEGEAQPRLYTGTNMEVSMPTGSLCAERNAIGSALADDLSLRRTELKVIGVLGLVLPKKSPPSKKAQVRPRADDTRDDMQAAAASSEETSSSSSSSSSSSAASLTFDSAVDACLLLACLLLLALARFRPLKLCEPLLEAAGVFKKLDPCEASVAALYEPLEDTSGGGGGAGGELVVVAGGSAQSSATWRRVYQWRSGETYYENVATGELLYPDGGPKALLEELGNGFDETKFADDVAIGPGFKVCVRDRSDDFEALWGHKFAATRQEKDGLATGGGRPRAQGYGASAGGSPADRLFGALLDTPDAWLAGGLLGCAALSALAGACGGAAYHALTGLGIAAGLLAHRHLFNV